jgi:sulfite dehydrogenase (cytochrome) subunit B
MTLLDSFRRDWRRGWHLGRVCFVPMVLGAVLCALTLRSGRAADYVLPADTSRLKPGDGVAAVTAQCVVCHSLDYIETQPKMSEVAWTAAVVKMRDRYGAPIPTNQVSVIARYLARAYGVVPP